MGKSCDLSVELCGEAVEPPIVVFLAFLKEKKRP